VCADGHTQTLTDVLCVLTDSHGRPVCAEGHTRTSCPTWAKITQTVHGKGQRAESRDQRADMCTDGQPRTSSTDVMCVLVDTNGRPSYVLCVLADTHGRPTNTHGQPRMSCVCWRTPTDVLCVLTRQPTWAKITRTVHGRVNVLSPRTNVLICVLMDSHVRPVCGDGHTRTTNVLICVLTDTHGRPLCAGGHPRMSYSHRRAVCAGGHPRTSCVHGCPCMCWRTPTDVLCVLTRQPTWAKITRTVHGKGQRAESKDQRADMCTDGQPQTSCTDTHGRTQTATEVLCVLADTHGRPVYSYERPVCAGGHPRTHMDSHGRPVTVRGCYSPRGPKSPKQSTGRASMLSPRTNVLICVLMDSHGRPVFADEHDEHTWTHTDSHGCAVCAGGHPRPQPTWAKITRTVHGKGQRAESKDQRADMSTDILCVLTDTHGHTRTATNVLCVLTETHGHPPQTSCVCWRTPTDVLSTDVLCVLADTHRRPVCTEQIAHVGQNHPNSPREGPACRVQGPTC
ncbi:unnamed protein product, partial [Brassica rapa]